MNACYIDDQCINNCDNTIKDCLTQKRRKTNDRQFVTTSEFSSPEKLQQRQSLTSGNWTAEMDHKLRSGIDFHGTTDWHKVARYLNRFKSAEECAERWLVLVSSTVLTPRLITPPVRSQIDFQPQSLPVSCRLSASQHTDNSSNTTSLIVSVRDIILSLLTQKSYDSKSTLREDAITAYTNRTVVNPQDDMRMVFKQALRGLIEDNLMEKQYGKYILISGAKQVLPQIDSTIDSEMTEEERMQLERISQLTQQSPRRVIQTENRSVELSTYSDASQSTSTRHVVSQNQGQKNTSKSPPSSLTFCPPTTNRVPVSSPSNVSTRKVITHNTFTSNDIQTVTAISIDSRQLEFTTAQNIPEIALSRQVPHTASEMGTSTSSTAKSPRTVKRFTATEDAAILDYVRKFKHNESNELLWEGLAAELGRPKGTIKTHYMNVIKPKDLVTGSVSVTMDQRHVNMFTPQPIVQPVKSTLVTVPLVATAKGTAPPSVNSNNNNNSNNSRYKHMNEATSQGTVPTSQFAVTKPSINHNTHASQVTQNKIAFTTTTNSERKTRIVKRFTAEEDEIILQYVRRFNHDDTSDALWIGLAEELGRVKGTVKTHYMTLLKGQNDQSRNSMGNASLNKTGSAPMVAANVTSSNGVNTDKVTALTSQIHSQTHTVSTTPHRPNLSTQPVDLYSIRNQVTAAGSLGMETALSSPIRVQWTKDMDALLHEAHNKYGDNWHQVTSHVGFNTTSTNCQQRWRLYVDPIQSSRKRGLWTNEEVTKLYELVPKHTRQYGVSSAVNWSELSRALNRRYIDCSNKWSTLHKTK